MWSLSTRARESAVLSCHFSQQRRKQIKAGPCAYRTIVHSSQHVAARPGTRHQRKTASNYAGSSILLCSQQAAQCASVPVRKPACHANRTGLRSKEADARATHRFWRLGRLRASLPIGPLAFLPVGTTLFLLSFAGRRQTGFDGQADGRRPSAAGTVANRCWSLAFCSCLLAVARTLDSRAWNMP